MSYLSSCSNYLYICSGIYANWGPGPGTLSGTQDPGPMHLGWDPVPGTQGLIHVEWDPGTGLKIPHI